MSEDTVVAKGLVPAAELAATLDLSISVLNFLERQVPQLSAVMTGLALQYRADDAALLAGLADLLYAQGVPLKDARWALRSGEREAIAEVGRKRIAPLLGDLARRVQASQGARRPIPRDAKVRVGGRHVPPPQATPAGAAPNAAVLRELMSCVRLLEEARGEGPTGRGR